jgi:drug/metabolite transporter (DMT)-like permease
MPIFVLLHMRQALIQLHIAVFLWGFTGVLGRVISLNEGWLVWWRLLITVVAVWLLFGRQQFVRQLPNKTKLYIAFIGFILALHWLCFYGSIKYSNVSIALTCLAISGLLSAFLEPLFNRKSINWTEVLLGLFALAGIVIVYRTNLNFSVGVYIGLVAALLTVLVSVLNKKLVADVPMQSMMTWQMTGSFLGLSFLMPLYHQLFPTPQILPVFWDAVWITVLSLGCTVLPVTLYFQALKKVSAFTMNLTLTLEPVYGILLAFVVYQEHHELSSGFYYGFVLIVLAVVLQMIRVMQQHRQ